MSTEFLQVPTGPFLLEIAPVAIAPFLALSALERGWIYGHASRSSQDVLVWSLADSLDAPHDLWVLQHWNDELQAMVITDLGHFPALTAQDPDEADEDRWDNEGGASRHDPAW